MRRWVSLLVPLIGLAIFAWILKGTGVGNILDTMRRVNPYHLLVFPLFTMFILWVRGLRWLMLMRVIGIEYPLRRAAIVWSIGFFGAAVTPGKVGDAVRAFYLNKETDKTFGECFLTVFMDRLMDLVTMLVFAVITILLFSYHYFELSSVWIVFVAVGGIFAAFYLMLHRGFMKKAAGPIFRFLVPDSYRQKLSGNISSFYDSVGIYFRQWKALLGAFILTALYWAVVLFLAYTVTQILGIDVSVAYIFLIMPMVTLAEVIPISISGLGTREAAVVYFFSVVGIDSASAVAFSIMYLFAGTYLTSMVGWIAWMMNPMKLKS